MSLEADFRGNCNGVQGMSIGNSVDHHQGIPLKTLTQYSALRPKMHPYIKA